MNKQSLLLIILAYVLGVGSGWQIHSWKSSTEKLALLEAHNTAQRIIDDALDKISISTQEAIDGIQIRHTTINKEALTEIREIPVYSECIIPVQGVELINKARRNE